MRLGIANKVLLGLAVTLAVVVLSYWLSLGQFQRFRASFEQVSRDELPDLVASAELMQESTFLLTYVPDILLAQSKTRFSRIKDHIEASVERADRLVAALRRGDHSSDTVTRLTDHHQKMTASLAALIALRAEHLGLERKQQRIYRRIDRLSSEIDALLRGAQDEEAWGMVIVHVVELLLGVPHIEHPVLLRQRQDELAELTRYTATLLVQTSDDAAHAQRELEDYGLGNNNLFELRLRELELEQLMQENLQQGRTYADALLAQARTLFEQAKRETLNQEQAAADTMADVSRALTILASVSLLALLAIHLFIRRSVIGRLLRLQRAIKQGIEQQLHEVPVEGHDEIGLMAQEVNYFIREIDRRERHLREAVARAEEASRAKEAFLANVSHEIRTPMNAVINLTRICLDGELPAPQRKRLEKVASAAGALLHLLNDILDLSRADAGQVVVRSQPFLLDDLLAPLDPRREQARAKGLAFTLEIAPATPRLLHGDRLHLGQILDHLVDNAVKFTERGAIEVTLRVAAAEGAQAMLEVDVRDSGIGIAPERIESLFDAFAQADSSTTRRHGGTGVGLALSRRLVQALGGDLAVESRPGAGSRFALRVPIALAEPQSAVVRVALPESLRALAGGAVLLAEDNAFNQEVAENLLRQAQLRVDIACDGAQAVEMARHGDYALVLMDIQMPVMDGFEATRRIRAGEQGRRLPIIALTASALPETRDQCLAAGMDDLLAKPIEPQHLYQVLGRVAAEAAPPAGHPFAPQRPSPRLARLFRDTHGDTAGDTAGRIERALAAGDLGTAYRLAHDLKSAGATLGAGNLTRAARELEECLREAVASGRVEDPAAVAERLAQAARELRAVLAALPAPQEAGAPS